MKAALKAQINKTDRTESYRQVQVKILRSQKLPGASDPL
jgi:hypothetical protein